MVPTGFANSRYVYHGRCTTNHSIPSSHPKVSPSDPSPPPPPLPIHPFPGPIPHPFLCVLGKMCSPICNFFQPRGLLPRGKPAQRARGQVEKRRMGVARKRPRVGAPRQKPAAVRIPPPVVQSQKHQKHRRLRKRRRRRRRRSQKHRRRVGAGVRQRRRKRRPRERRRQQRQKRPLQRRFR